MKRKSLLSLMLLCFAFFGVARADVVEIGEGTTSSSYLPGYNFYNYSLTQQIYPACEIGMAGTINSIAFKNTGAEKTRTYNVYMLLTNKDSFTSTSDWVAMSENNLVFSGSVTFAVGEWTVITLDTPFTLDGSNNLLVGVADVTGSYSSSPHMACLTFSATNQALYTYRDGSAYNIAEPGVSGTRPSFKNQIQLNITPNPNVTLCCPPEVIAVPTDGITAHEAVVNWGGGSAPYNLQYKPTSETEWTDAVANFSDTTYTLTGLTQNTTYQARVQSSCGSTWKTSSNFTTLISVQTPTELACTGATTTTATLVWKENGTATSWILAYKAAADENFTEIPVSNDTTYTITGLTPATYYNVKVCAVGNGENSSWSNTISFATDCVPFSTLPWNENFDSYTTGVSTGTTAPTGYPNITLPICWQFLNRSQSSSTYPQAFLTSSTTYAVTGNCLFFKSKKEASIFAILPEFTDDIADLYLTFTYRNEGTTASNGTLYVGYMTNPADSTSFIVVDTCAQTTTKTEKSSRFDGAPAGSYMAFMYTGGTSNNYYMSIDNVVVTVAPTCYRPSGLAASNVTNHTAMLSWTENGEATAWQICLNDDEANLIDADTMPFTVTGLDAETRYTAKVRANCGGNNGVSEWCTTPVTFTTLVACAAPTGLTATNATNQGATLNWNNDAGEWVVAYKAADDSIFREIPVTEKPYVLTGLMPETTYNVKVKAVCGGIDGESLYTNTVNFTTLVACPAPNNLVCTAITATAATLDWTERGDATAWEICLNEDTTNYIQVSEKPYTLENLTPETIYTAKVRSACGSDWSSAISFEPTAKLVIGSGTATSGYLPGYLYYNYSFTQQIYTVAELGEAGMIESIDFYCATSPALARTFDIYMVSTEKSIFTNNAKATDWIPVTESDKVCTKTLTLTQGWNTFTLSNPFMYDGENNVAIIICTAKVTNYENGQTFRVFDANAQSLYVYNDGSAYDPTNPGSYSGTLANVKNQIRILKSELPDCLPPTGLTVNYEGGNTAVVSWTSEETSWNMQLNGEPVEGPITNPFTLTGLEMATEYTVEVQNNCGSTTSNWVSTSFTTDPCMPEDMCAITLDLTDSYGDGWNGNAITVVDAETGRVYGTYTIEDGSSATYQVPVCDQRTVNFVWTLGSWAGEASWVITSFLGDIISEGVGTSFSDGAYLLEEPFFVKCQMDPCDTPVGLAAEPSYNSAELTWNGGAETYYLRYREVGEGFAWDSFTQVGSDITADSVYQAYNFDLRSYAGQSGHIAIRHYNVSDQYVLLVDDVTYNNGSEDVFSIDFEDGIPEGCMLIDKDGDGFNWQRYHLVFVSEGDTTNAAHSGEYGLWSASYDNASYTVLTPDNWVITPYMELGGTLTFYAKGLDPNYASEVFGVFVSTVEELSAENPWIEVEEPITGTSYSLTGLTPLVTYEFQVQVADKACSDPEPEWSASKEFTTLTDKIFVTDGNWNEGTNWISGNVPAAGVDVIINANAIIPAGYDANVNEIEMGEGATITIQDGGQLHHNNTTGVVATVEKNIAGYGEGNGNWYLISAPFRSYYYTSQVANLHMADSLCDFYGFDATQNEQEWRNYKQTAISSMLNGKGYLYANPTDDTLKFTGTTAPQLSNLAYINGGSSSYPLSYNDSISELNWNLVGNSLPHNAYVYVGIVSGGYVYFAENQYYYKMNETGTDIIAADNEMVKPMEGVFVLSSAASQYAFASSISHGAKSTGLNINLAQDNALIDRALIRFGEGSGLQKFQLKSNHTKVYMTEGDKDYAVLFTDSEGKMPLSFQAETEGTYTISYTAEGVSLSSLFLIDNETGEKVDLLANPSYTFETKAGDFAKRFTIVYGTK